MTPNHYKLLERCIEEGLVVGYNRAFKHTDSPSQQQICDAQEMAIMSEISEWFDFAELK
jgi:hypothetical protein